MSTEFDADSPCLSVCIPTYNRPEILDFGLERLATVRRADRRLEVVISDNAPSEATARVVEKHRAAFPELRYCMQGPQRVEPYVGFINAVRNATGRYVVYMADDDMMLAAPLWAHVERLESEPAMTAIFADWIAYDDQQERELHRYYYLQAPAQFGPDNPLGLVNFVLQQKYFPDMGLFRRAALLKCDCLIDRGVYPCHLWMYRLAREGTIRFDPAPFYHENRVLKQRFSRGASNNMQVRLEWIGDELRSVLETLLLWALQDCGHTHVPADQVLAAKGMIDDYLHQRLNLEIGRAIHQRNWLLALALRRRQVLWHGPGTSQQTLKDVEEIVLAAALQAVREMCGSLSAVSGLVLEGFSSHEVHDFYAKNYPALKLLDAAEAATGGPGRAVHLCRQRVGGGEHEPAGYRFYLDELLQNYRLHGGHFDLGPL